MHEKSVILLLEPLCRFNLVISLPHLLWGVRLIKIRPPHAHPLRDAFLVILASIPDILHVDVAFYLGALDALGL